MVYIHIQHRVENYTKWREVYEQHKPARQAGGATDGGFVMRNTEHPEEITVLIGWTDLLQARAFVESTSLKEAMRTGGVLGLPEVRILETLD